MVRRSVSTKEAAARLDVDPATIINMIRDGRLSGEPGQQPVRPRWRVHVNDEGLLIAPSGTAVEPSRPTKPGAGVDLESRVAALERALGPQAATERYREASLLLSGTLERQRQALDLQARATQELNEALAEQSRIITTLLVPGHDELVPTTD